MKNHEFVLGDVAESRMGRDQGNRFAVVGFAGEGFVLVADGQKRLLASPKKKNVKHLRFLSVRLENIGDKLERGVKVFDSELKSALRQALVPSENIN